MTRTTKRRRKLHNEMHYRESVSRKLKFHLDAYYKFVEQCLNF